MRFKNPQEIGGLLGSGTALADLFLQVRINGDAALLKGLMKVLVEQKTGRPARRSIWRSSATIPTASNRSPLTFAS